MSDLTARDGLTERRREITLGPAIGPAALPELGDRENTPLTQGRDDLLDLCLLSSTGPRRLRTLSSHAVWIV